MKLIKQLGAKIVALFNSPAGHETIEIIVRNTPVAMKYIEWAAELTPTSVDDFAFAVMRKRFPRFFNGEPFTDDEMKLLRFVFASEALISEVHELNHSTSRAAVSNAFAIRKAEQSK